MSVVRTDLSVPLGTQLFWQLRYQIATGEYAPGERLPTVREMAAALRVNANTIRGVYARPPGRGLGRRPAEGRHGGRRPAPAPA
jgi:GntR family transcriptional regulator